MTHKINLTRQQKLDVVRLVKEYEFQNEKQDLENKKDQLENEITQIQTEVQQYHTERKEVENENTGIIKENKKLKKSINDLKRKLAKIKSDNSLVQIRRIGLYNEKEQALNERDNLRQQKEMLMSLFDVITTNNSLGEEEEEEEENNETKENSEIYQQLDRLNQEVADRCNEISNLKSLLDTSTNLIKKLQTERNEILKTVSTSSSSGSSDKNKKTQKKQTLNKNLDDLASSIVKQNEAISTAMKEEPKRSVNTSKSSTQKSPAPKSSAPKSSTQKSSTQQSSTQKSSAPKSSTPKSSTEKSSTQKSSTGKSSTEKSSTQKSSTEKSSTPKSSTEKSSTPKSSTEKSSTPKSKPVKRDLTQSPRQQSATQVNGVISNLQKQISDLTKENTKLQSMLEGAEEEHELIFMSLGISKYSTDDDDKDETNILEKQTSRITNEIKRIKDELSEKLEEIANLKQLLADSTNTIMQLTKEHDDTMQLIELQRQQDEEECSYSSSNQTILLENLDELVIQIENQNESMNQEISQKSYSNEPVLSPHKRDAQSHTTFKRPQNTISESFKKIQNELKEATALNLEKDAQIEELEEKIRQLADEHKSILQALYGSDNNDEESNNSELIDNLDTLNTNISQQNETINSAITEGGRRSLLNKVKRPSTNTTRRNRTKRPQGQVIAALNKIRNDLKKATEANFDKDAKIEELENQINEIRSGFDVTERSVNISIADKTPQETIESQKRKINELENQNKASTEKIQQLSTEVKELKDNLNQIYTSVKKVNKLIGCNSCKEEEDYERSNGKFINIAQNLESKLMKFITKSAAEQSDSSTDLEKKIIELNEQVNQLQNECKALNLEKNAVLSALGVNDEDSDHGDEEYILQTKSPLFKQVQSMTKTVEDQLNQINELKRHLVSAAKTIQQLSNERYSFMQALMPGEPVVQLDSATNNLFKNLEALGLQITKQNEDINSAIEEDITLDARTESSHVVKSPRRERERLQRPQNFVISALNKIRSQLENAQQEISDKEIKIAQLEKKIESFQKA